MNTIRRAVGIDRRDADGMLLYTKLVALPSPRENTSCCCSSVAWDDPPFVVSPLIPSSVTSHCLNAKCIAHAVLISHWHRTPPPLAISQNAHRTTLPLQHSIAHQLPICQSWHLSIAYIAHHHIPCSVITGSEQPLRQPTSITHPPPTKQTTHLPHLPPHPIALNLVRPHIPRPIA
jgi:hypothetical protein